MIKRLFTVLAIAVLFSSILCAQGDDPVLFTVEGKPVHVSEFTYIYSKTNGKNADFSKKSVEEYLELYTKFKLKVQRAREMQLDTIPQLISELEGYRRQLADSYLLDKEVTDRLIKEAYGRAKQDVDISHVLITVPANASPADTTSAYKRALEVKGFLNNGEAFEAVAKKHSADKSAQKNGGNIGFVTVPFPNGFYPLETAAYTLAEKEIHGPIRTSAGYHLLKVNGRRPARGEMEAAHILIRTKDRDAVKVKATIDSLHALLKTGVDFEQLAKTYSEDKSTAGKGGYIGFFPINRYERVFEDAAFGLKEDEQITAPFQSSVGWHVVKRISKKGIQPFEIEKGRLETKIKKDARYEKAKAAMLAKIKLESGLKENSAVLNQFIASQTDTFLTFKWKAPKEGSPDLLFSLGDGAVKYSLGDFTKFLGNSTRKRLKMGKDTPVETAVKTLYTDFLDQSCLKYEESRLEDKYPEFKALMREYQEGILLFEATKMLVWDKASQDSVGLATFYETIKGKYRWEERAVVTKYRLNGEHKDKIEAIREAAAEKTMEEVLAQFNTGEKAILAAEEKYHEKTRFEYKNKLEWKVGAISSAEEDKRRNSFSFVKIEKLVPPEIKTLKEARGYVVADYQDQLEKNWVESLSSEYEVKLNQDVLKSLIKK